MRVLIVGGTGLISTGIVKHLIGRRADVTLFNRGRRNSSVPASVKQIHGDRDEPGALEKAFADERFDVVIDMIGFRAAQAEADVRAFGGKCEQLIFCSTVCTYGIESPGGVFVDETFPQKPISGYGRDKVECETILRKAAEAGKFKLTIIRPSSTYGEGGGMIDNVEFNPVAWDRIERGLPVLCAGDGLGLWVSTHRDDCGKAFAYAAMNAKTYGQSYNATRAEHLAWRDYYKTIAGAMGKTARLVFMPAAWIVKHDPARFGLLREITAYHGAYDSSKARRDIPEFRCDIGLAEGARRTLEDVKSRGQWRDGRDDSVYQSMVDSAIGMGIEPVEA